MEPGDLKRLALDDGRTISYREWQGSGRPLVLIHGLLDSSAGFTEVAGALPGSHLIGFDLPGFGDSNLPTHATIASYTDDIEAALAELDIKSFYLCGHSLGGAVAAELAGRKVGVEALCLLAPTGFGRIPAAEVFARRGVRDVTSALLPFTMANPLLVNAGYAALVSHHRLPSRELSRRLLLGAPRCAAGASYAVRALSRISREPLSARSSFTGPVSVLWGRQDRLVSIEHEETVKQVFPQADVRVVDGIGHHPQHEAPEAVREVLTAMIENRKAGRTASSGPRRRVRRTGPMVSPLSARA